MGNDLTRRVRENTTGVAAATNGGGEKPATIGQQIQRMENSFQLAMPKGAEAAQLIRDALTCLRQTPKLAQCEPQSVLGALMTCAQLGLRPGVLGHAWLLPFWDKNLAQVNERGQKVSGAYRAQLVVGYQGLVELAHRSGQIKSLIARTVYSNDTFDVEYGLEDDLVHKPALSGSRGTPIAYYAVAKFVTGGHAFLVMTQDEMEVYRDRYAMAKTKEGKIVGPWVDQFEGMALKTTVRQLSKWMPKSTEFASAIEADGTVRVDLTPHPDAMLHGEQPEHEDIDGEFEEGEPEAEPGEPTDAEEKATRAQLTKLHTQLGKLGVSKDEDKLRVLGILLKRPVESSTEATKPEASGLIELLDGILKQAEPAVVLERTLTQLQQTDGA